VVDRLTGPITDGKEILFQKQMTHHLLPEVDRQWLSTMKNCFLIRDPAEVIASYLRKNDRVDLALEDLGFVQQLEIFNSVKSNLGKVPPVIDARDVLENPEKSLRLLCDVAGVEFDRAMLSWPPGLRDTDGVWAQHWYGEVAKSTSFQPYQAKNEPVPSHWRGIHARCQECYDQLYEFRLRKSGELIRKPGIQEKIQ
jgi:hypothetical protein